MTFPNCAAGKHGTAAARFLIGLLFTGVVAACSHVPLTTMVKLRNFDLLNTDPGALRIAVKYPDSIRIPDGGATMRLAVTETASGAVQLEEELAFEQVDTPAEKAELASELQTGWRIDVYRLPPDRVAAFKAFQSHLNMMSAKERDLVDGSMNLGVDACLATDTRPDRIVVSTYLKASELGEFVPILEAADLKTLMAAEGLDDGSLPLGQCPESSADHI